MSGEERSKGKSGVLGDGSKSLQMKMSKEENINYLIK
jgi:hypothetical protein